MSLGFLGLVHPHLSEAFGLPEETAVFELDFEKLAELTEPWGTFKPIPSYPEVYEEFSFILPEDRELGRLIEEIKTASDLVWETKLTDRFKTKGGERSITLRVTFQSPERSLSTKEVKPAREKIQKLIQRRGGTLRA